MRACLSDKTRQPNDDARKKSEPKPRIEGSIPEPNSFLESESKHTGELHLDYSVTATKSKIFLEDFSSERVLQHNSFFTCGKKKLCGLICI